MRLKLLKKQNTLEELFRGYIGEYVEFKCKKRNLHIDTKEKLGFQLYDIQFNGHILKEQTSYTNSQTYFKLSYINFFNDAVAIKLSDVPDNTNICVRGFILKHVIDKARICLKISYFNLLD